MCPICIHSPFEVTISPTSAHGLTLYHQQEKDRFEKHDQPFAFDILGVKSLVAPLKGITVSYPPGFCLHFRQVP